MTEPTTPAPPDDAAPAGGCGFQLFGFLLVLGLLALFHYLGWWPRERGWRTGLAFVSTAALAGGVAVALASLWDRLRGR